MTIFAKRLQLSIVTFCSERPFFVIDIEDVCERRRQKSLIGNDFANELKQKESVCVNLRFRSVKTTIGVLTLPSPFTVDANTVML